MNQDARGWSALAPPNIVAHRKLQEYVAHAIAIGWRWRISSNHHLMLQSPDGVTTQAVSLSKVSHRAVANQLASLRRAGIDPSITPSTPKPQPRMVVADLDGGTMLEITEREIDMPKGQPLTEEQIAEVRTLRAAGEPVSEVARMTGVSTKSVSKHAPATKRADTGAEPVDPRFDTASLPPYDIPTIDIPDLNGTAPVPSQEPPSAPEPAPVADYPITLKLAVRLRPVRRAVVSRRRHRRRGRVHVRVRPAEQADPHHR